MVSRISKHRRADSPKASKEGEKAPSKAKRLKKRVKKTAAAVGTVAVSATLVPIVLHHGASTLPLQGPLAMPAVSTTVEVCRDRDAFEAKLSADRIQMELAPSSGNETPPPSMAALYEVKRPKSFTDPVDPVVFVQGNDNTAHVEWKKRLDAQDGRASLAPVGVFDPSKPLLVLSPGRGGHFSNLRSLVELADTYQVVIGIYDTSASGKDGGEMLGDAMSELTAYRDQLACERGITPSRELAIAAHSMGGIAWTFALDKLAQKGELTDDEDSLYDRVNFVPIDTPWRGADSPWAIASGNVTQATLSVLRYLELPAQVKEVDGAAVSLVNRALPMNTLMEIRLPGRVQMQIVTADNLPQPIDELRGVLDATGNWSPGELQPGELNQIWEFFASDSNNADDLDNWALYNTVRKQGLQQLVRTLGRDADGAHVYEDLRAAAKDSLTLEAFQPRYDAIISKVVTRFEGEHTQFMMENPGFLPFMRKALAGDLPTS